MSEPQTQETAAPRPNKIEEKRQRILADRLKRHMAKGLSQSEAEEAMAKEDYERLPIEKKLERHTQFLQGGIRTLAKEIRKIKEGAEISVQIEIEKLQHNDVVLADAMDVNFKALAKLFTKLGISLEEQAAALKEAEAEVEADKAAAQAAREAEEAAAQEQEEKQEASDGVDRPGTPAPPPDEATQFGG